MWVALESSVLGSEAFGMWKKWIGYICNILVNTLGISGITPGLSDMFCGRFEIRASSVWDQVLLVHLFVSQTGPGNIVCCTDAKVAFQIIGQFAFVFVIRVISGGVKLKYRPRFAESRPRVDACHSRAVECNSRLVGCRPLFARCRSCIRSKSGIQTHLPRWWLACCHNTGDM